MGQQSLQGATLTAGSPTVVSAPAFPAMSCTMPLGLLSEPKPYDAATGVLQYNLNSPLAFIALAGIGASSIVTEALTFVFRTQSSVRLRLTFDDATVSELAVQGMLLIEPPDGAALVLVEAKGLGLIEYFASGK